MATKIEKRLSNLKITDRVGSFSPASNIFKGTVDIATTTTITPPFWKFWATPVVTTTSTTEAIGKVGMSPWLLVDRDEDLNHNQIGKLEIKLEIKAGESIYYMDINK